MLLKLSIHTFKVLIYTVEQLSVHIHEQVISVMQEFFGILIPDVK